MPLIYLGTKDSGKQSLDVGFPQVSERTDGEISCTDKHETMGLCHVSVGTRCIYMWRYKYV